MSFGTMNELPNFIFSRILAEYVPALLDLLKTPVIAPRCRICNMLILDAHILLRLSKVSEGKFYLFAHFTSDDRPTVVSLYCLRCSRECPNSMFFTVDEVKPFQGVLESLYVLSQ